MYTFPMNSELVNSFINENKSYQFNFKINSGLPDSLLKVANSMAQIIQLESVYIVQLNDEGDFLKTQNMEYIKPNDRIGHFNKAITNGWPIKIEDMETYNFEIRTMCHELERISKKPVNCHLFWGHKDKGSFGWHEDDGNVWAYLVKGEKLMETESESHIMKEGDWVFMPKGLKHKATNLSETILLSFGNFDFWQDAVVLG